MNVSVIIPTRDRQEWVLRSVQSLMKQDYAAESYEVIAVCDRCVDGTKESLQSAFASGVRTIEATSAGQAGALNAGLWHARGDLAIFLDDELEAEPGFISAHARAHQEEPSSKIVVTGYSPVVLDSASTPFIRLLANNYEEYFSELAQPSHRGTPRDLCGCNFSAPARALREVGGFNESYFFQRNDFELAVRLLDGGYEIRFCREARANQHLAVTTEEILQRTRERAQNDCRLAQEYPWCVPHLDFFRVLQNRSVRLRWRVLWETSGILTAMIRAGRMLSPENLRLVSLEYAARYCAGLRQELGDWERFCRLATPVLKD